MLKPGQMGSSRRIKKMACFLDLVQRERSKKNKMSLTQKIWFWSKGFTSHHGLLFSLNKENIKDFLSDYHRQLNTPFINGQYSFVLNNKFMFYMALKDYGNYLPEHYCLMQRQNIININRNGNIKDYDSIIDLIEKKQKLVVKKNAGGGGKGVLLLEKRVGLNLSKQDVYVNAVGGITIQEPAADLGIALAVATCARNVTIDPKIIIIGEIGLSGEIRSVNNLDIRIKEAAKLGFTKAIVPSSNLPLKDFNDSIKIIGVSRILEAITNSISAK